LDFSDKIIDHFSEMKTIYWCAMGLNSAVVRMKVSENSSQILYVENPFLDTPSRIRHPFGSSVTPAIYERLSEVIMAGRRSDNLLICLDEIVVAESKPALLEKQLEVRDRLYEQQRSAIIRTNHDGLSMVSTSQGTVLIQHKHKSFEMSSANKT
jgi:hypothetical protein